LISGHKLEHNNGIKFILGPGTGIGEAILKKSELPRSYEVISTEGGHKGFTPVTDEHIEYLIYLRKKKNSAFIS
jgi:glucokinase